MPNAESFLYIMSGLPGTGKTTLSQMLARHLKAVYLRIDTVEQALRDLCAVKVGGEGYRLSYRVATDNLKLGNSVVADSCNPILLSRTEWEQVARDAHTGFVNIEIQCSDKVEHRQRVESRKGTVPGLVLPTWEKVMAREYDPWVTPVVTIDTASRSVPESFDELIANLGHLCQNSR